MSEQWKINDSMIADPDAPKLCVDCHWCDPDSPTDRSVSRYACHVVPDDTKPSLITGKVWATFSHTCEFMRGEHTKYDECERCGPEGRHWQAKRVCDTCAVKDCFASFRYLCCPDFKRTCDNCARELANGDKCDSTDGMMCGHWMMKGDTRRRDSYMWKAKASPTPVRDMMNGDEKIEITTENARLTGTIAVVESEAAACKALCSSLYDEIASLKAKLRRAKSDSPWAENLPIMSTIWAAQQAKGLAIAKELIEKAYEHYKKQEKI